MRPPFVIIAKRGSKRLTAARGERRGVDDSGGKKEMARQGSNVLIKTGRRPTISDFPDLPLFLLGRV